MKTFNLTHLAVKQEVTENTLIVIHPSFEPIPMSVFLAGLNFVAKAVEPLDKKIGWVGHRLNITKARLEAKKWSRETDRLPHFKFARNINDWYCVNEEVDFCTSLVHFINYKEATNPFVITVEYVKGLISSVVIHQTRFDPENTIFSETARTADMVGFHTLLNLAVTMLGNEDALGKFVSRANIFIEDDGKQTCIIGTEEVSKEIYKNIGQLYWSTPNDRRDNKWCLTSGSVDDHYTLLHVDGFVVYFQISKELLTPARISDVCFVGGSDCANYSKLHKEFVSTFIDAPITTVQKLEVTEPANILVKDTIGNITDKSVILNYLTEMTKIVNGLPETFTNNDAEISTIFNIARAMREELIEIDDRVLEERAFKNRRSERINLPFSNNKKFDAQLPRTNKRNSR